MTHTKPDPPVQSCTWCGRDIVRDVDRWIHVQSTSPYCGAAYQKAEPAQ